MIRNTRVFGKRAGVVRYLREFYARLGNFPEFLGSVFGCCFVQQGLSEVTIIEWVRRCLLGLKLAYS